MFCSVFCALLESGATNRNKCFDSDVVARRTPKNISLPATKQK